MVILERILKNSSDFHIFVVEIFNFYKTNSRLDELNQLKRFSKTCLKIALRLPWTFSIKVTHKPYYKNPMLP
jgi:hypothetical protein